MSNQDALQPLATAFARFENHQFPGFPDSAELQQAYEELVEKGGQLTALIQRLLTGGAVSLDQVPTFAVALSGDPADPETHEFRHYRSEIDLLVKLLRKACD